MCRRRATRRAAAGALVALVLAGCGNSGNDDAPIVQPPPTPPPPTNFTTFVKDQFNNTADDAEPADVDEEDFEFTDLDDPGAFDDLLM